MASRGPSYGLSAQVANKVSSTSCSSNKLCQSYRMIESGFFAIVPRSIDVCKS